MGKKDLERIAVISCVHGNIAALEAVLSDIKQQKVDRIVCLGDLVGYGPYPNEVIKLIEKENIQTVMGCWDEGIAKDTGDCGCHFASEEDEKWGEIAFSWTRRKINKSSIGFLKELPFGLRIEDTASGNLLFVHGSPRSTSEYLMESTHDLVLLERAASGKCDILICGHTHIPYVRELGGMLAVRTRSQAEKKLGEKRSIKLSPKLIINAGSVGEPRHGRPHSTYVVFDSHSKSVFFREVPYEVSATVSALKKFGLPSVFSERLAKGSELIAKSKEIACAC